jgi:hypothetical protein
MFKWTEGNEFKVGALAPNVPEGTVTAVSRREARRMLLSYSVHEMK